MRPALGHWSHSADIYSIIQVGVLGALVLHALFGISAPTNSRGCLRNHAIEYLSAVNLAAYFKTLHRNPLPPPPILSAVYCSIQNFVRKIYQVFF